MRIAWNISHTIITTIGGIVGYFLGGLDGFIIALVTFVALDYATGVVAAYITGSLSSTVGFTGIARKVMIFALVGVANILDVHVLGEAGILRTATIFFYLANEGLSIVENATRIGLPVPDKLRDALAITAPAHTPGRGYESHLGEAAPPPPTPPATSADTPEPPTPAVGGFFMPDSTREDIKEA